VVAVELLAWGAALAPAMAAQDAPPPSTTPDSPTHNDPPARRKPRPIHDSIDSAIDEVMSKYENPCSADQRRGVPCFPTSIETEGPHFSVAEALRRYRAEGSPAESAPITPSDMQRQMSGAPLSASGGVSMDPVCTARSLIRRINGKASTFYLYSLSDGREARPVLTDRKLEPAVYASNPEARYEFLGRFSDECAAIAAWRRELRKAVAPPPAEPGDEATTEDHRPAPPPAPGPPPP
jgi:hypothetical protein